MRNYDKFGFFFLLQEEKATGGILIFECRVKNLKIFILSNNLSINHPILSTNL